MAGLAQPHERGCEFPSYEDPLRRDKRFGQAVNLFSGIVHRKGGAAGGGDAITGEERLGAVRPGTDRYARSVDDGRYVVRMSAFDIERHDSALIPGAAENAQRVDLGKPRHGIIAQIRLMDGNGIETYTFHVIERGAKANRLHDRWRPRLNAMRRIGVGDVVK